MPSGLIASYVTHYKQFTQLGHTNGFVFICALCVIAAPFLMSLAYFVPAYQWVPSTLRIGNGFFDRPTTIRDLSSVLEVTIGVNLALTLIHDFTNSIKRKSEARFAFYKSTSFEDTIPKVAVEYAKQNPANGVKLNLDPNEFAKTVQNQVKKEEAQFNKACDALTSLIKLFGLVIAGAAFVLLAMGSLLNPEIPVWLGAYICISALGPIGAHFLYCRDLGAKFVHQVEQPPDSVDTSGVYSKIVASAANLARTTATGGNNELDEAIANRES